MERVKKIKVTCNGRTVGYLAELGDLSVAFQYDAAWQADGFPVSPFSLPLSDKVFVNKKNNFGGLYGVFHDSLPDGWGELLVRRMLAAKGIDYDKIGQLTKLTLIGSHGLGALTYEPCLIEVSEKNDLRLDEIAADTRKMLADEQACDDLDNLFALGGSSGGARPKAHLTIEGTAWIIKFPCLIDPPDIGEKELAANMLAKKCGINVNEFRLFPSGKCSGYFGAKRFDRVGSAKVHMISLSSILETSHRIPNLDYLHLLQVTQSISSDRNDVYEAYRRMCFNILYGNKDDHGKNFAFLYDESSDGYKLSPAYDITKTPLKAEHEMTVCGVTNPTEKDLLTAAEEMKLSVKECRKIIDEVKSVVAE